MTKTTNSDQSNKSYRKYKSEDRRIPVHPDEIKIRNANKSHKSALNLDSLLNIDYNGRLTATLYYRSVDFVFASIAYHS
jgi:hypothetical protein